jgi:hypothetical protein
MLLEILAAAIAGYFQSIPARASTAQLQRSASAFRTAFAVPLSFSRQSFTHTQISCNRPMILFHFASLVSEAFH